MKHPRTSSERPKGAPEHQLRSGGGKKRSGPVSRSSLFFGVTQYKRTGRWEAHIWAASEHEGHKGRQLHLGSFPDAHPAALAYDRAAYIIRPNDSVLNFPTTDYSQDSFIQKYVELGRVNFVRQLRIWAQSDELALECGLSPSRARVATYRKQKRPTSPVGAPPLAKRRSSSRVVKGYVLSDLSDAGSVFSCGGGEATDSDFKLSDTATGSSSEEGVQRPTRARPVRRLHAAVPQQKGPSAPGVAVAALLGLNKVSNPTPEPAMPKPRTPTLTPRPTEAELSAAIRDIEEDAERSRPSATGFDRDPPAPVVAFLEPVHQPEVHWKPQSHAVATLEAVPDLSKVAPNKQEPEWGGGQPCEGWRGGSGPVRPVFEEVTFNGHSWIHGSTVLPFEHLEYHLEHVKRGMYPAEEPTTSANQVWPQLSNSSTELHVETPPPAHHTPSDQPAKEGREEVGSPCAMLYGNTKCEWESPEAANGLVDTEEWDAGSLTCNFLSGATLFNCYAPQPMEAYHRQDLSLSSCDTLEGVLDQRLERNLHSQGYTEEAERGMAGAPEAGEEGPVSGPGLPAATPGVLTVAQEPPADTLEVSPVVPKLPSIVPEMPAVMPAIPTCKPITTKRPRGAAGPRQGATASKAVTPMPQGPANYVRQLAESYNREGRTPLTQQELSPRSLFLGRNDLGI